MKHTNPYRLLLITLALSLCLQGCKLHSLHMDSKPALVTPSVDDELTRAFAGMSLDEKLAEEIFIAISNQDNAQLKKISKVDNGVIGHLLERLLKERIITIAEDLNLLSLNILITDLVIDGIVLPKLRTITQAIPTKKETEQEKQQREQNIQKVKSAISYIQYYQKFLRRCRFAYPLTKSTAQIATYRLKALALDHYSDSEEETADHFNGIYNGSKFGLISFGEEAKSQQVFENFEKSLVNNYVACFTHSTPSILKKDAEDIHANLIQINTAFPSWSVTILCVALRKEDGNIKKFVFTNLPSLYQYNVNDPAAKRFRTDNIFQNIITSAHSKGYHVIMTQQAHAEGAMLQFLQERPTRYTHLISMGCSRDHCEKCGTMLNDIFPGILEKTSANIKNGEYDQWLIPKALEHFLEKHNWTLKGNLKNWKPELNNFKSQVAYGLDYEKQHKPLNAEAWKNRPWIKSNHKVKFKNSQQASLSEEIYADDEAESSKK